LIDSHGIFRKASRVRWWDIHNYCKTNWHHHGLHEQVKQQNPKFIDATSDPFPEKELVNIVTKNQLHTIAPILVPDLSQAQRHRDLNFVFYPLWLLSAIEKSRSQPCPIKTQRTYALSCLNRQPRLHRFLTYYLLSQQSWFDQMHISFAGLDCDLGAPSEVTSMDQLYVLGLEVKNYFDHHRAQFPRTSEPGYAWDNCHDAMTSAYQDCWANLATETSVHAFCVTEKTTKPLQAGSLFFPVASAGFVDQLADMGFDMDYTGIDYSFDKETGWQQRTKQCIIEISRVYNCLENIWHANLDRIKYNSELFVSDSLLEYCLQDVKEYV